MALHASCHRDFLLLPQSISLTHRSVAGFTACRGLFEMFLMAEEHVIGQTIDATPLDWLVLLVKLRQALNGGALLLHCAMAAHALGGFGNGSKVSGLGDRVAAL